MALSTDTELGRIEASISAVDQAEKASDFVDSLVFSGTLIEGDDYNVVLNDSY